jgi:hypothetical protein
MVTDSEVCEGCVGTLSLLWLGVHQGLKVTFV